MAPISLRTATFESGSLVSCLGDGMGKRGVSGPHTGAREGGPQSGAAVLRSIAACELPLFPRCLGPGVTDDERGERIARVGVPGGPHWRVRVAPDALRRAPGVLRAWGRCSACRCRVPLWCREQMQLPRAAAAPHSLSSAGRAARRAINAAMASAGCESLQVAGTGAPGAIQAGVAWHQQAPLQRLSNHPSRTKSAPAIHPPCPQAASAGEQAGGRSFVLEAPPAARKDEPHGTDAFGRLRAAAPRVSARRWRSLAAWRSLQFARSRCRAARDVARELPRDAGAGSRRHSPG